jgi:hypothetical protein
MTEDERNKTEIAWPHWMLRYLGSGDKEAMEDLIGSVGGSPPYGGVSDEEASAVYDLIEDYRGPDAASAASYERMQPFTAGDAHRQRVLEIFRCADEIQSDSARYGAAPVKRGLALSRQAGHRGVEASFLAYEAGLLYRSGNLPAARDRTLEALDVFLEEADEDPVYATRVRQTAQNAVSLTAMGGDQKMARELLQNLARVIEPAAGEQPRQSLGTGP